MTALNYPFCNIQSAVERFAQVGTVAGLGRVEPADVAAIDLACESDDVERWRSEPLGWPDVDDDNPWASWPDWCDEWTWELGPEDGEGVQP
jgi:hypothetical protein